MSQSAKKAFITEIFQRDNQTEASLKQNTKQELGGGIGCLEGVSIPRRPVTPSGSILSSSDEYCKYERSASRYYSITEVCRKDYIRACKHCGVVPLSGFLRQIGEKTMSLKFQLLSKNAIKSCAIALLRNLDVQCLDLEGCQIGLPGAKYVYDLLQQRSNISELNLSSNKLETEGLRWMVQLLQSNHHIKSINLSNNQFTDGDAMYIADILHGDNIVNELNLSHNRFAEEGGLIIGSALEKLVTSMPQGCNDTIKILNLSWNHLRGKGAHAIGLGLQKNTAIKILNVSWNGFDVAGCHGLAHGLEKNNTLVDLDVSSNRIGIMAVNKLLEGMKRNSSLEILRIGNNPITAQGSMLVLHTIKKIPNIKYVDLGLQPVDMDFVSTLIKYQKSRDLHATYGKVCLKPVGDEGDPTMYIHGDPVTIMFEFTRMKEVDVLDLFITFDTDGSHSLSWEEFKEGVQVSKMPVRLRDLDTIIKRIDINMDGEINFSELMIAQKEHNLRVKKLMDKGERVFLQSEIGRVHQELLNWFEDKGVTLKHYSLLSNVESADT